MNYFKRIVATASLVGCFMLAPTDGHAIEKGEKTFGVRTGYVSRNRSADAGLYFQYTFSNHFRLAPAADLVFRHHDRDAFLIDLNAHVPFAISEQEFTLYPLAGVNYSSWNRHYPPEHDEDRYNDDVSTRTNRFGVNLGAGFDVKVSSTLKITLEASYTLVKSNCALRVLAGIGYVF